MRKQRDEVILFPVRFGQLGRPPYELLLELLPLGDVLDDPEHAERRAGRIVLRAALCGHPNHCSVLTDDPVLGVVLISCGDRPLDLATRLLTITLMEKPLHLGPRHSRPSSDAED